MAKLTKLINYAYLKEECDLPTDLPDDEFEHKILRAQDTLKMLIGSAFYADYLAKFEAGTVTTDYPGLVPFVKQYLAWQAHEYWVWRANYKITRAGFRVHSENNSTPASDTQMAAITKDAKQETQKYKVFMIDYLNDNYTLYPLYERECSNDKTGNSFHITAVRAHKRGCGCSRCHAH
jgi:hypothetical protein